MVTTGAAPVDAPPDPYAIYEQADAFWFSQHYPVYLSYDVAVEVTQDGTRRVEHYTSSFDAVDGAIWVDPVSDYEQLHPYVPHGVNVTFFGFNVGKPEPPIDFIGVPLLTPTYTFGMAPFVPASTDSAQASAQLVAEIRRAFHDPYPPGRTPLQDSGDVLPEIAHAVAVRRVYVISFVGVENVNGHGCYHLTLKPVQDPGRYRLRELWIDEQSGATWRLREALNFVDGPGTTVPWSINFSAVNGVQYISDEEADSPVNYRGQTYSSVAVRFENLEAAAIPEGHPLFIPPQSQTLREPQ